MHLQQKYVESIEENLFYIKKINIFGYFITE